MTSSPDECRRSTCALARRATLLWVVGATVACGRESTPAPPSQGVVPAEPESEPAGPPEPASGSNEPAGALTDESRAPSTARMEERLRQLAQTINPGRNLSMWATKRAAYFRQRAAKEAEPQKQVGLQIRAGIELLNGGMTQEALASFRAAQTFYKRSGQSPRQINELLATASLRLGEQSNCIARHSADSCLFPLGGSGLHQDQTGSRQAIVHLTRLAEHDPAKPSYRWLLNLAYMTLGEYPDGVPLAHRISPETFASDFELPRFTNIAGSLGVDVDGLSGGAIMDDFDGDGRLDLVASDWGTLQQLRYFRNAGDGTFSDQTASAGLTGELGGLNLVQADYDNDGWLDILVLRGAWFGKNGGHPNSLIRNRGDGRFEDVTEASGLLTLHPTPTATWGDFDNDGWLDLFVGNESEDGDPHPCELFRNNGDGTFTDVAPAVGLDQIGFVKGSTAGDYDNDGDLDLYLSLLGAPNRLLRNDRGAQWTFVEVTEVAGVQEPTFGFPTWFWDYDNDGWLDLFAAPFPGFSGEHLDPIAARYLGMPADIERARLYRNRGDGRFEDVTARAGLDEPMLAMGANFGDFDNDGWLDVYVGTGEPSLNTLVPNRAYRNTPQGVFGDVATAGGLGHLQKGHGIAFGDLDNDGAEDIYAVMGGAYEGDVAHNALFHNPGSSGHAWITLRLQGTESPRCAIGARIRIDAKDDAGAVRSIHRVVTSGGSFGSSSLQQEVGLGSASGPVDVEVTWPRTGARQRFEGLEAGHIYRLIEGHVDEVLEPSAPISM